MSSWKSRPAPRVSEVEDLKALAANDGRLAVRQLAFALRAGGGSGARLSGAPGSTRPPSSGRKTFAAGIRTRNGSGQPGGFGVFDPGINALSIVTHILPSDVHHLGGTLDFPENRASPIAAHVTFRTSDGLPVTMELDWLQTGPQSWDILADTDKGKMVLSGGGAKLAIDGKVVHRRAGSRISGSTALCRDRARPASPMSTWRRSSTSPTPSCSASAMWWRLSSTELVGRVVGNPARFLAGRRTLDVRVPPR